MKRDGEEKWRLSFLQKSIKEIVGKQKKKNRKCATLCTQKMGTKITYTQWPTQCEHCYEQRISSRTDLQTYTSTTNLKDGQGQG